MDQLLINPASTVWAGAPLVDGAPLLVVMHGYGANQHDLVSLLEHLPREFAAACLRAPLDLPAPYGDGAAWFPIEASPSTPRLDIADAATVAVWDWLAAVREGVTPGPIVLLGFSQGGAMVTHLLRHYPGQFDAGVVLSGFTVPGDVAGDTQLRENPPPVFWGYDTADPIVPPVAFARTRTFGADHFNLTERTYQVAHGIDQQELADVRTFLDGVLPTR